MFIAEKAGRVRVVFRHDSETSTLEARRCVVTAPLVLLGERISGRVMVAIGTMLVGVVLISGVLEEHPFGDDPQQVTAPVEELAAAPASPGALVSNAPWLPYRGTAAGGG